MRSEFEGQIAEGYKSLYRKNYPDSHEGKSAGDRDIRKTFGEKWYTGAAENHMRYHCKRMIVARRRPFLLTFNFNSLDITTVAPMASFESLTPQQVLSRLIEHYKAWSGNRPGGLRP